MFTELDDKAWELFKQTWDLNTMTKNKHFFVYHKESFPYSKYYEKAKTEIRKEKIEKIRKSGDI
jgi:hypothetical protein